MKFLIIGIVSLIVAVIFVTYYFVKKSTFTFFENWTFTKKDQYGNNERWVDLTEEFSRKVNRLSQDIGVISWPFAMIFLWIGVTFIGVGISEIPTEVIEKYDKGAYVWVQSGKVLDDGTTLIDWERKIEKRKYIREKKTFYLQNDTTKVE